LAFPGRSGVLLLRVQLLARAPFDRAVPKRRPSSSRVSTVGRASLATRLEAERLPVHMSPLRRHHRTVSTPHPDRSRADRRRGNQPPRSFRPRGFSPPRRLPPPHGSRVCCISQPTLGSTGFRRLAAACLLRRPRLLTGAHALQSVSSPSSRACVTARRCPLAVRHRPGMVTRPRGLAPPGSPSDRRAVADTPPSRGSPGFPLLPSSPPPKWGRLPTSCSGWARRTSHTTRTRSGSDACGARRCRRVSASSQRRRHRAARRLRVLADATPAGDHLRPFGSHSALWGPPAPRRPRASWTGGCETIDSVIVRRRRRIPKDPRCHRPQRASPESVRQAAASAFRTDP
jgi:hypothetical protein